LELNYAVTENTFCNWIISVFHHKILLLVQWKMYGSYVEEH